MLLLLVLILKKGLDIIEPRFGVRMGEQILRQLLAPVSGDPAHGLQHPLLPFGIPPHLIHPAIGQQIGLFLVLLC